MFAKLFWFRHRYDKILVIEPVAEVLCEERTTTLLGGHSHLKREL